MADEEKCSVKLDEPCTKPARMAIKTTNTKNNGVTSTLYFDNRLAPKVASRYCKAHGREIAAGLCDIVDNDDA